MLDVGFSEILLTSAIALIVLGPERLPKVARQVGNWMGRARAMARQLTEQLEREVSAEELLKLQTKAEKDSAANNATARSATGDIVPGNTAPPPDAAQGASVDMSYTPTTSPGFAAAPAPPAQPQPAEYSPEAAAAPHGADWHISPPASKTGND